MADNPTPTKTPTNHNLFGKILATVITGAIEAEQVATGGVSTILGNPSALANLISGFASIWLNHPASTATPAQTVNGQTSNSE